MTGLRAGAASVDITPTRVEETYLAGFAPDRRATGVLEPLAAHALALYDGNRSVAFVSLDLIGLGRAWIDRIRCEASALPAATPLLCGCTHTHSGPDTLGLWGRALFGALPYRSGVDPAYMQAMVQSAGSALDRAWNTARPARVRAATFETPTRWTRNDRGGARDDVAVAVAFDDVQGDRIATLCNYASHPETLWDQNTLVSPDYPGAYRRHQSQLSGGEALFLSGPLGAMLTPDVPEDAADEARRAFAEQQGRELAELCEARLADVAPADASIEHSLRTVSLPNANWRFSLFRSLGLLETELVQGKVELDLHRVCIGDVECVSVPGELVPELGHELRSRMSARHRVLFGLCGEEVGYILEPSMFDDPQYAYERTVSLGRDTGRRLMEEYAGLL